MDNPVQTSGFWEILTTKEVMERLKIGRTKLFELKRKGTLIPGRHFIKNGRFLRFVWGTDLIEAIHENPGEKKDLIDKQPEKPEMGKRHSNRREAINLDY